MSLSTLPEECLLHIFSCLPGKDSLSLKMVCKLFKKIVENGWRYLEKPRTAEIAIDHEEPRLTIEVRCDGFEETNLELTSNEVRGEKSWREELSDQQRKNMAKNPNYCKRIRKQDAFWAFFARGLGCENFSSSNPAPIQSIENGLELLLRLILRHCNLGRLALRGEGYWTSARIEHVHGILKDSRAAVTELGFETDQIPESMAQLIRFSKCESIVFTGLFEQTDFDRGENSVDRRIREFDTKDLTFYPTDLVSVETILYYLQEWRSGQREIEKIIYNHSNHHFDWFAPMSDFQIITPPYDHIWTMNATIHVKTFVIGRRDEKELEVNYYTYHDSSYMEVKKHWSRAEIAEHERQRKETKAAKRESVGDLEDNLMGLGLFD